jgi:hypothetical protein
MRCCFLACFSLTCAATCLIFAPTRVVCQKGNIEKMNKMNKKLIAALFGFSVLLAASPALAAVDDSSDSSSSSPFAQDYQPKNAQNQYLLQQLQGPYMQAPYGDSLSLSNRDFGVNGPLDIGVQHSSQFGTIVNSKYTQDFNDANAIGLEFDIGGDENREGVTWGGMLSPNQRIKITGERLAQMLDFDFATGNVNQSIPQYAGGVEYQYLFFNSPIFQDLTLGGYYSKADSENLSTIPFVQNGVSLYDLRHIAGARAQGFNIGTDIYPWQNGVISLTANYDSVNYPMQYTTNFVGNKNELGYTIDVKQLIFNRHAQVHVFASHRAIYDEYGAGVGWLNRIGPLAVLTTDVDGMHIDNHNLLPNDNRIMLNFGLAWTWTGKTAIPSTYADPRAIAIAQGLRSWVDEPAVHMDAVLATADELVTSTNPNPGPNPNPSPVVFVPSTAVIYALDGFSSQATFPGTGLTFSYQTTANGQSTVSGLPYWVHISTQQNGSNTILTLSGNGTQVASQSTYTFTVTTSNSAKQSVAATYTLTVVPRNLSFSQIVNNQVPAVLSLTQDSVNSGSYVTAPPSQISSSQGTFSLSSEGAPIAGSFTYKVTAIGSPYIGLGCVVVYTVDKFGNLTETASPLPATVGGATPNCQITTQT